MAESSIKVTLLGTGTPVPSMDRFGPSTLVEANGRRFVFDCGRGVIQRLFQIGVPIPEIDTLLLTHLHSDHVVGIPDLWLTGWVFGRRRPFRVWGPEGTARMMSHLEEAFHDDIHIRRDLDEKFPAEGIEVAVREIQEGVVYEQDGMRITAFDVDHRPVVPALGFRIDYSGRSVVLSGDTRYSENLVSFAQGADLLVHEVIAPEAVGVRRRAAGSDDETTRRIVGHHTTPQQAGEIFSRIGPRLAVYSHIVGGPGCDEELLEGTRETYSGPFEIGVDLMTVVVGDTVNVERPS